MIVCMCKNMVRGKVLVLSLLFVGAVAVSVTLLHPRFHGSPVFISMLGCSRTVSSNEAYRTDLNLLSRLSDGPSLLKLTDGGESASEVLVRLSSYHALVVVTAGRDTLARRAAEQPFISIAPHELSHLQQQDQQQPQPGEDGKDESAAVATTSKDGEQDGQVQQTGGDRDALLEGEQPQQGGSWRRRRAVLADGAQPAAGAEADPLYGNGLAALARTVGLMNTAAVGVEQVLGRRLFPITISTFDRSAAGAVTSGPYAIFDASAGALLLDRKLVSYTWGGDMPQVSYIAGELATRVFSLMSDTLRQQTSLEAAVTPVGGGAAAATAAANAATAAANAATAASSSSTGSSSDVTFPATDAEGFLAVEASGGGAAAAAARIAAAALALALPAVFAAAPPLWFCILCPSVLGLMAPLLINLALNQVAGLLCTQLHLDDQVCFDVMLGALGAGFVLSLASAVPIFFVCRLPECAGKNVTAALRRLAAPALRE